MTCPECKHPASTVTDSRPTNKGRRIRRRRECCACKHRWTTEEVEVA
jgi:transcriptional repressor NrdR